MRQFSIVQQKLSIFFRMKLGEAQYMEAFNDELSSFKSRIEARAKVRIQEAIEAYEEVKFVFNIQ